jgi:uncharacterized protein with ATP-grasp and redox domains
MESSYYLLCEERFFLFQIKISKRDITELDWCLDEAMFFETGYHHVNQIGQTPLQQFINHRLSQYMPFIWPRICKAICSRFFNTYRNSLSKYHQEFYSFSKDLLQVLRHHKTIIQNWSFADLAAFLNQCLQYFLIKLNCNNDLFKSEKQSQNTSVLPVYHDLRTLLLSDEIPFKTLLYLCCKANRIDSFEKDATQFAKHYYLEVLECLESPSWLDEFIQTQGYFDYNSLYTDTEGRRKHFLIELDNHGELFFDFLLSEYLLKKGHKITLSTKSFPVLNDVTYTDCKELLESPDLQHFQLYISSNKLTIIQNGNADVIKSLYDVSEEFKHAYSSCDIVISKGQGHFESFPHCYIDNTVYTNKLQKIQYKKNHYHLINVKSFITEQSLQKIHKDTIKSGSLYCYKFKI